MDDRKNGCKNPFQIEWVKGDTTETINNLKDGKVDVGITYSTAAERLAIENGIAGGCNTCSECNTCKTSKTSNETIHKVFCGDNCDCCDQCDNYPCYLFRDHFYLVGPKGNLEGKDKIEEKDGILTTFSKIFSAAEKNSTVRFLSRYDKSATNIKESELWIKIGQVSLYIL
jgi:ABC-type tungstate transport system permease subunit